MTNSEQTHAYYQGLNEQRGVDPMAAEDLGVPMSPETVARQIAAGKEVAALLAKTHEVTVVPQDNQKGGLDHIAWGNVSSEQRIINQRGVQQVRDALTSEQPKE